MVYIETYVAIFPVDSAFQRASLQQLAVTCKFTNALFSKVRLPRDWPSRLGYTSLSVSRGDGLPSHALLFGNNADGQA